MSPKLDPGQFGDPYVQIHAGADLARTGGKLLSVVWQAAREARNK